MRIKMRFRGKLEGGHVHARLFVVQLREVTCHRCEGARRVGAEQSCGECDGNGTRWLEGTGAKAGDVVFRADEWAAVQGATEVSDPGPVDLEFVDDEVGS
jgi:hypothetical protein